MEVRPEDEAELKALWRRFRKDIAFFAEKMLGPDNALRPKQIEFAQKFQKNRLITFKGGVGFGKTRSMAVIIIWALFVHDDIKITVFGPSQDQIKNGLWSEIKSLYERGGEIH